MLIAVLFVICSVADASKSKSAQRSGERPMMAQPKEENAFLSINSHIVPPGDFAVEGENTKLVKGRMCMWGFLVFLVGLQWTWNSQLKSSTSQILNRLIGCLIPFGVIVYFTFWTGSSRTCQGRRD